MSKGKKIDAILVFVLIAGVLIYTFSGGATAMKVSADDNYLTVSVGEVYSFSIPITEIVSVELAEDVKLGNVEHEADNFQYGASHNAAWGDYTLLARRGATALIVVKTQDKTFVFNYDDDGTTRSLMTSLPDYIEKKTGNHVTVSGD